MNKQEIIEKLDKIQGTMRYNNITWINKIDVINFIQSLTEPSKIGAEECAKELLNNIQPPLPENEQKWFIRGFCTAMHDFAQSKCAGIIIDKKLQSFIDKLDFVYGSNLNKGDNEKLYNLSKEEIELLINTFDILSNQATQSNAEELKKEAIGVMRYMVDNDETWQEQEAGICKSYEQYLKTK